MRILMLWYFRGVLQIAIIPSDIYQSTYLSGVVVRQLLPENRGSFCGDMSFYQTASTHTEGIDNELRTRYTCYSLSVL